MENQGGRKDVDSGFEEIECMKNFELEFVPM